MNEAGTAEAALVADFDQVVESIARDTVVEIQGPVVARGSMVGVIAALNAWLQYQTAPAFVA